MQEHSPKLGKPKKHPAYCVYVAYRLTARGSEPAGSSDLSSASTPFSGASGEEEEDDMEVAEELEDKQLSLRWPDRLSRGECLVVSQCFRLEQLEQENRVLKELLGKLDHGRSWLEERVGALEQAIRHKTCPGDVEKEKDG